MLFAYVIGGLICVVGQGIMDLYQGCGLELEGTMCCTSITLVFLGALFTGLGLYGKLTKHAGAGTIVPITGFANAVVSPAMEFRAEGMVLGLAAKMFVIAGPVLVYGITASVGAGLIYWIFSLF